MLGGAAHSLTVAFACHGLCAATLTQKVTTVEGRALARRAQGASASAWGVRPIIR